MFERVRAGRLVGSVALLLGATAACLGPGCATTSTPQDGQSHWLGECSSDDECGALDCVCGRCTRACWRDDACGSAGKAGACRSIATVVGDGTCAREAFPASVCTVTCGRDADCRGYGSALACSGGVCVAASGGQSDGGGGGSGGARTGDAEPADAFVPPDATDVDPDASGPPLRDAAGDTGPVSTACAPLASGTLPSGVAAFRTTVLLGELTVEGSTVYGTGSGEIWRFVEPSGPVEHLFTAHEGASGPYIHPLVADGADLFYGRDDPIGVARYTPATDSSINVAVDTSVRNVRTIVVDGDAVYWLAGNGTSPHRTFLMRSDRDPGTTTTLATVDAYIGALQLLGDWFYFTASPEGTIGGEVQLYRMPKASGTAEALGSLSGIVALTTDGTDLFAGLRTLRDNLDNPIGHSGATRVNVTDGSLTPLFTTPDVLYRTFAVDDTDLYWASGLGSRTSPGQLWRGRKDGSGDVVNLAEGWAEEVFGLAVTDAAVYWTVRCTDTSYLVRAVK